MCGRRGSWQSHSGQRVGGWGQTRCVSGLDTAYQRNLYSSAKSAAVTAEHVLFVTVDSLRADVFAESREGVTPTLARLANDGTEFTQAVANGPNTPSSFPTILTGTHPMMYGGYRYLNDDRPFLSKTLKDAGFTTAGYHSNPHLGPEKNYNAGFDVFNDGEEDSDSVDTVVNFVDERLSSDSRLYSVLRRLWHMFGSAAGISAYDRASSITDDAIAWLDGWDGDRFFIWIHYMDVHYPFQPPNEHLEAVGHDAVSARRAARLNDVMQESPESLTDEDVSDLEALYRGETNYVDHNVGRLLDTLSERGLQEETMVVLTADHGEAFGEHGRWGHHPHMYDELLRVPLIVDDPNRPPETVDRQVSLVDLFPTICDACDVDRPSKIQGENLYKPTERVALGTSNGGERLAARTSEWKLLWHVEEETVELYNLADDPSETTDVSERNSQVVDRLRAELEQYREAARSTDTEVPAVEESEAVKQRLRDLGYTD
jgi:arylsulfatase A-like enzyme